MKFWWPVFLIVGCTVMYQTGIKAVSSGIHPLTALIFTYLAAALTALVVYLLTAGKNENKVSSILSCNFPALGMGLSIVGIEIGMIYMYRAGWGVHNSFIVTNSLIVIALMVTGALFYQESLKRRQFLGILLTMAGVGCIVLGG